MAGRLYTSHSLQPCAAHGARSAQKDFCEQNAPASIAVHTPAALATCANTSQVPPIHKGGVHTALLCTPSWNVNLFPTAHTSFNTDLFAVALVHVACGAPGHQEHKHHPKHHQRGEHPESGGAGHDCRDHDGRGRGRCGPRGLRGGGGDGALNPSREVTEVGGGAQGCRCTVLTDVEAEQGLGLACVCSGGGGG